MKRIGILIVAYNAASTLASVLDRIRPEFKDRVSEILICDDHSKDSTYLVGLGYKQLMPDLPLTVIRQPRNFGYGGNQKSGYQWAIDHDLDIVVLLHGDGQYAPEVLDQIVAPLENDECDAVFGSRMLEAGSARRGGMPMYKYVGNRILTTAQNALAGTSLSEWHSGYRAYSVKALREIPFQANSDGFVFDTEIITQLVGSGKRIVEIPIPTYYGDEICYVNGMGYARDVIRHVVRYRMHKMGFGSGDTSFDNQQYELKHDEETSHGVIREWLGSHHDLDILDLGCAEGVVSLQLVEQGNRVTGVDIEEWPSVAGKLDRFVAGDLDQGLPEEIEGRYDVILAADVLEHLREPGDLLKELAGRLAPNGWILASIPNAVHWYPRLRMLSGRFDYDRRGILDSGHLRFFTRRSFERLAKNAGLRVTRCQAVGLPVEIVNRGGGQTAVSQKAPVRILALLDRVTTQMWPNLFAYQYVLRLDKA
jgi:2-polyprenyl-3-methyl-5-hydroxy-6-metoxy-1,4-benzoquinol methylase